MAHFDIPDVVDVNLRRETEDPLNKANPFDLDIEMKDIPFIQALVPKAGTGETQYAGCTQGCDSSMCTAGARCSNTQCGPTCSQCY